MAANWDQDPNCSKYRPQFSCGQENQITLTVLSIHFLLDNCLFVFFFKLGQTLYSGPLKINEWINVLGTL